MPRFGRVWWAASDLAKDWNGYLEGGFLQANKPPTRWWRHSNSSQFRRTEL